MAFSPFTFTSTHNRVLIFSKQSGRPAVVASFSAARLPAPVSFLPENVPIGPGRSYVKLSSQFILFDVINDKSIGDARVKDQLVLNWYILFVRVLSSGLNAKDNPSQGFEKEVKDDNFFWNVRQCVYCKRTEKKHDDDEASGFRLWRKWTSEESESIGWKWEGCSYWLNATAGD